MIIALAVTRDGMPVRSWVLPGDTADVTTVQRIKEDLRQMRLGRALFVGDAGLSLWGCGVPTAPQRAKAISPS